MATITIYTQYYENYSDTATPYWKPKGGQVFEIENIESDLIMYADDNFITTTFFPDSHDDVVGWLSRDEINDLMDRISNHGNPQKDIPGFEGTLDQLNKLKI